MQKYELTVVFHPDLEMNLDPALDKVKKLIETNGGKILKDEVEPKRRLAYRIKGQDFGVYYFATIELPAEAPGKISTVLAITEEVIRYLLVKVDERKAKMDARKKSRSEESDENSKEENEKGE